MLLGSTSSSQWLLFSSRPPFPLRSLPFTVEPVGSFVNISTELSPQQALPQRVPHFENAVISGRLGGLRWKRDGDTASSNANKTFASGDGGDAHRLAVIPRGLHGAPNVIKVARKLLRRKKERTFRPSSAFDAELTRESQIGEKNF